MNKNKVAGVLLTAITGLGGYFYFQSSEENLPKIETTNKETEPKDLEKEKLRQKEEKERREIRRKARARSGFFEYGSQITDRCGWDDPNFFNESAFPDEDSINKRYSADLEKCNQHLRTKKQT